MDTQLRRKKEEVKQYRITPMYSLVQLFYTLVSLFAAYLCFKVNKGFSWTIILALMFSPIYIVYVLAAYGKKPFKSLL